ALLHVDLDRFKHINDTLGHAAGDAMLVHASSVLKSNVGDSGFVARVGGDEFIVLCMVHEDVDQAAVLANRIIEQMRRPVYYHGHQCRFGVSVGIAIDNGRV
ncbi:GGDEF domain-containing protein, partial [Mesorhizobium sp. M00.F.Ca.ET.186.01.1.1]